MKKMKMYLVSRNDSIDINQYDAAVIAAESPNAAIELLKKNYEKFSDRFYWGNFNVSVTEIVPDKPKIILESFNAG